MLLRRRVEPDGTEDLVLVVVNLDPHATRETTVHLDMGALGRQWWDRFTVRDEITGAEFEWGEHDYVRSTRTSNPLTCSTSRADGGARVAHR